MASRFCDPLAPSPCDHCGDNTKETLRCSFKDNKNLCQDCFQSLPNAKREDIGEPEWVCKNPCNQKVKFFCKTCHLGICNPGCAGGVHGGHDVVCVIKLAEEIRRDLTEQYRLVTKKADEISQQQGQFLKCIKEKNTAFEEARGKVVKTVNGVKNIIKEDLEKKIDAINEDTDKKVRKLEEEITSLRAKRVAKIKELANEALDDISRIDKIHRDIDIQLLEDEESRNGWIPQVKCAMKDNSKACESAKKEIKNFLDSKLESHLVLYGGLFRSLVKSSLLSQSQDMQDVVVKGCKEVGNDLPKLFVKDQPQDFIRSKSKSTFCTWVAMTFMFFVVSAGYCEYLGIRMLYYNDLLNSYSLMGICLALFDLLPCYIVMIMPMTALQFTSLPESPFEFRLPFRKAIMQLVKLVFSLIYSGLLVICFQILLYRLGSFFQMDAESKYYVILIISLLHSYYFYKFKLQSKTFKQVGSPAMSTVHRYVENVIAMLFLVFTVCALLVAFSLHEFRFSSFKTYILLFLPLYYMVYRCLGISCEFIRYITM